VPNAPTIILYDGWCSLCTKSAAKLRKLDNNRSLIELVDLREHPSLIEQHHLDPAQVRRVMHAITPDATVLTAMDALAHALTRLGRGWLIRWTRLPILRKITDRLYLILADNRHRWFSRHRCIDGSCEIPDHDPKH
jgi:predicted DCC family thiol-disulfide oxidoreductase YuxK